MVNSPANAMLNGTPVMMQHQQPQQRYQLMQHQQHPYWEQQQQQQQWQQQVQQQQPLQSHEQHVSFVGLHSSTQRHETPGTTATADSPSQSLARQVILANDGSQPYSEMDEHEHEAEEEEIEVESMPETAAGRSPQGD